MAGIWNRVHWHQHVGPGVFERMYVLQGEGRADLPRARLNEGLYGCQLSAGNRCRSDLSVAQGANAADAAYGRHAAQAAGSRGLERASSPCP